MKIKKKKKLYLIEQQRTINKIIQYNNQFILPNTRFKQKLDYPSIISYINY